MKSKTSYILVAITASILGFGLFILYFYLNQSPKLQDGSSVPQLYNLIREQELSGKKDEKTLLLESLKVFAGEMKPEQAFGVQKIKAFELTPLRRRANYYLQHGEDENAKKEIKRLLRKIYPDFSQPQKSTSQKLKQNFDWISPAFADGRRCLDELCFNESTFSAGGHSNQLLIEERVGGTTAFENAIRQATEDSFRTYQSLGLTTRRVVFLVMPMYNPEVLDSSASAAPEPFLGETVCLVNIWSQGVVDYNELGAGIFKQELAHEIFHCVQADNFLAQYTGPSTAATDWWAEGSAEYFSNVVYPSANSEYEYNGEFDANSSTRPVHKMSYEASVFFQFLGNEIGNDGILGLFRSLPTSGSFEGQQAALASYADMENLFHKFGKDYLDHKIFDTSGPARPLNPHYPSTTRVTDNGTFTYHTEPFTIGRQKMLFQPGTAQFEIRTDEDNPGKYNAQKNGQENWESLPERIGQNSCDSTAESEYKLVFTRVSAGNENYQLKVIVTKQGGETPPPEGFGIDPSRSDRCINGRWRIDSDSGFAALQSILPAHTPTRIQEFSFNGEMCANASGHYFATLDYNVTAQSQLRGGPEMFMTLVLNTAAQGQFSANGSLFSMWNVTYPSFRGQITVSGRGVERTQTLPGLASNVLTQIQYTCNGDSLSFQIPASPFPWVRATRISGR